LAKGLKTVVSTKRPTRAPRPEAGSQENVCVFHCDVRASFATAFSAWRRKNKIPLKTIAKDLGVSISTVDSWEIGLSFPGSYNFERLVEYTGLPPCKLFCVMADKCVPADCLLAMRKLSVKRR
jgi:hypothetical protein